MKQITVEIEGQSYKVYAERMGEQLWFHLNGETFVYEPPRKSRGRKQETSTHPGRVRAPMPGKIIKVCVAEGESVTKDQPVIVLEAMKMEYTLKADINGTVTAVSCSEGDQVSISKALVEIVDQDG